MCPSTQGNTGPQTARQWERLHGSEIIAWLESSGVKQRMLDDICRAVELSANWFMEYEGINGLQILSQYPDVLAKCDELDFNDPSQAAAYLLVHLADRYCRVWQVLEELLKKGRLPLGKSPNFSALDIGAGPGPGIFAVRHFYAALVHFTTLHKSEYRVMPLGRAGVIERSMGMAHAMHVFAEMLLLLETGRLHPVGSTGNKPPFYRELVLSAMPFGASHTDFEKFSPQEMHVAVGRSLAQGYYTEYEEDDILWAEANGYAHTQPIDTPNAYALVLMTNFLTTDDMVKQFDESLDRIMRTSLVPGGTVLCLGSASKTYDGIYAILDQKAKAAHVQQLKDIRSLYQEWASPMVLEALTELSRSIWRKLEGKNHATEVRERLKKLNASDIFDTTIRFRLPQFKLQTYRRGK
jgi:hypothetical protein